MWGWVRFRIYNDKLHDEILNNLRYLDEGFDTLPLKVNINKLMNYNFPT